MTILIVVAAFTVIISGLCSLFEATLYSTRSSALEAARIEGTHRKAAQRFLGMKKNIASPTSAILILNTLANTAGATICGMYAVEVLGTGRVIVFSLLLTLAILLLGEILPKTFGATHWGRVWHWIVWPLAALEKALYPLIQVTQGFAKFFTGTTSAPVVTGEEIEAMIEVGGKSGELTAAELQLLSAVLHFDEITVRQIMVPRREVVLFDRGWSLDEAIQTARRTKHTRYPLCDGSLDNAIGVVHIKDLLGIPLDRPFQPESVARPLHNVPETLTVNRLLRQMQSTHQHMATVVDEFGTSIGIVTLENVLEQLVGAVQDEFDSETPEIISEGEGRFVVQGQLPIDRINRELKLELESTNVDTISGLLVSRLGRLLKVGDKVHLEGADAEVDEVQAGRATKVRLSLTRDPAEEHESESPDED